MLEDTIAAVGECHGRPHLIFCQPPRPGQARVICKRCMKNQFVESWRVEAQKTQTHLLNLISQASDKRQPTAVRRNNTTM